MQLNLRLQPRKSSCLDSPSPICDTSSNHFLSENGDLSPLMTLSSLRKSKFSDEELAADNNVASSDSPLQQLQAEDSGKQTKSSEENVAVVTGDNDSRVDDDNKNLSINDQPSLKTDDPDFSSDISQNIEEKSTGESTKSQPSVKKVIEIAEPEPFPNPIIRRSHLRRVNVRVTETIVEQKLIIHSGSGKMYEIGVTLKKAIFGHVVHAIQLTVSENNPEECVRTGQQIAIKVYSKRVLRQLQGKTQENPLMEITALQYIGNDHPNLMGQIECCTDEDNIYSIMRYCQGGELFDFIDEHGPLDNLQAKKMFRQLLSGLQRLQSLGIGHRDMSLENILYDQHDIYVIIDFGMCLRLKKNSTTGDYFYIKKQQICGKKNYISPEVLREDPVFNPMVSDIWAAGIILFIILTGVPPIDKATHADMRYTMICEGRLAEMVNNWNLDLDPLVVDLIQKILHSNPEERLTIQEMLEHPWLAES